MKSPELAMRHYGKLELQIQGERHLYNVDRMKAIKIVTKSTPSKRVKQILTLS